MKIVSNGQTERDIYLRSKQVSGYKIFARLVERSRGSNNQILLIKQRSKVLGSFVALQHESSKRAHCRASDHCLASKTLFYNFLSGANVNHNKESRSITKSSWEILLQPACCNVPLDYMTQLVLHSLHKMENTSCQQNKLFTIREKVVGGAYKQWFEGVTHSGSRRPRICDRQ